MALAAWFFLLLLPPLLTILLLHKNKNGKKSLNPPGPPGLPLIGNLHQFDGAKPHEFLMKLSNKYGPLMSLRFGSVPVLVISSAKMAKEALKTHDVIFSGKPTSVCAQKLSYNGLDIGFSPYGDYWREVRKLSVLHLLSVKKVQSYHPIIQDEISKMIERISTLSSSSQLINLKSTGVSLMSTIVCRIAFGKKYDKEGYDQVKNFHQILQETEAIVGGFFISDYFPSLYWIDKLSGMVPRLDKNFKDLDLFYEELIEEHLNPNWPESMKNNILDTLIQLKEEGSSSIDFTWDHIKAILTNIFVAATNSSAGSVTWAMTALMKNPSVMKRVQAEIRDFFGKKGAIVEEELHDLPYFNAVIKETFRLYTPVPLLLPRQTLERCTIEGYEIEPKSLVFINAWAISRDPKTWEDPNEFRPERFLNSSMDVRGQDFEFIPFGAGRRGCPGISLGLANVELAVANLLYWFDWELPFGMKIEDIDTDVTPGLTLQPKYPLSLLPKKYA